MSSPPTRLLPPNSTQLERDLVASAARAADIPTPLREIWNVDTCPAELLPWLAWALAVKVWDPSWPEYIKRARIRTSVQIHRHRGTVKSVRDTIQSFGANIAMREWWQTNPKGTPHTFVITLSIGAGLPQTAAFQEKIMAAVDQTKPARSQYTLIAGLTSAAPLRPVAGANPIAYRRLDLVAEIRAAGTAPLALVAGAHPITYRRLTLTG